MKIERTEVKTRTEVTAIYTVDGAEPMAKRHSRITFRPTIVKVKIHDGELYTATLSGPRILKAGDGEIVTNALYPYLIDEGPQWLQDLTVQVLAEMAS